MKKLLLLAGVLMLTGCAPKVINVERNGETTQVEETRSCSQPGWCYRCGIGFDGKFSCGFGFSSFCDGKRTVTVMYTPVLYHYDDGSSRPGRLENILEKGSCK